MRPIARCAAALVLGTIACAPTPGSNTSAPAATPLNAAPAPGPLPAATAATAAAAATPAAAAPLPMAVSALPDAPPTTERKEFTVPSGTSLSITLATAHSSGTSRVEETIRGALRRGVVVDGTEVVPAGARMTGQVVAVERSGRVKGRATLALRFTTLLVDGADTTIATAVIAREAAATKKRDAAKVGLGAGAGALIGAITGGRKGAARGAALGAGAGTGVVLATRGEEVNLDAGAVLSTRLTQPLIVLVKSR